MSHKALPQPFPLSKTMDTADLDLLQAEVRMVESYQGTEGQHPARVWEYAMAHRAIKEWVLNGPLPVNGGPLQLCDVGGAGSRFHRTLVGQTSEDIMVIDPALYPGGSAIIDPAPRTVYMARTVEDYAAHFSHDQFDVITCLSVLEHVPEVPKLLRACRMLLKPGGLLFLTMDYWNCSGPDTAQFHWMRERIYNADSVRKLCIAMREIGFRTFGRSEWKYNGNHVRDYSFCSLAMVKK